MPEAESSRLSMDVEQGRKRQLESIVEEGVGILPESPGNFPGGLNEKNIPEFNITDVPPVHGDIQDVQGSPRQNIEVPTHQTSYDQDLDEMNQQAHIGKEIPSKKSLVLKTKTLNCQGMHPTLLCQPIWYLRPLSRTNCVLLLKLKDSASSKISVHQPPLTDVRLQ